VSYTRSKLTDDASSVFDASILTGPVANFPVADSFNRRLERDYSTGDIPHVFVASGVWDLPLGANRRSQATGLLGALVNDWTLTGVLTFQSGVPIAVTQTDQQQCVRRVWYVLTTKNRPAKSSSGSSRVRVRDL
jgi:hypothetical protein